MTNDTHVMFELSVKLTWWLKLWAQTGATLRTGF